MILGVLALFSTGLMYLVILGANMQNDRTQEDAWQAEWLRECARKKLAKRSR